MKPPMIRAAELAAERPDGWATDEHFPALLAAFVIQTYSRPTDRVLDPFAGSGATIVAAQQLGRRGVGVELLADRAISAQARVADPSCIIQGNALDLDQLNLGTFELCLTSPPYMNAVDHPQNPLTGYRTLDGDYHRYLARMGEVFASIARHHTPAGVLVLSVANIRTGAGVTPLADDLVAAAVSSFTVRESVPLTWDHPPAWLVDDRLVVLEPKRIVGHGGRARSC